MCFLLSGAEGLGSGIGQDDGGVRLSGASSVPHKVRLTGLGWCGPPVRTHTSPPQRNTRPPLVAKTPENRQTPWSGPSWETAPRSRQGPGWQPSTGGFPSLMCATCIVLGKLRNFSGLWLLSL